MTDPESALIHRGPAVPDLP